MQLSTNFTLAELIFSSTAVRHNINNTPAVAIVYRLKVTCSLLEAVRLLLDSKPMHIDSGYRCPELNTLVNGSEHSAHCDGFAVDFICPDYGTPDQIFLMLKEHASLLQYDQLILEGTWVHISFDPKQRKQNLIAEFKAGETTHYKVG